MRRKAVSRTLFRVFPGNATVVDPSKPLRPGPQLIHDKKTVPASKPEERRDQEASPEIGTDRNREQGSLELAMQTADREERHSLIVRAQTHGQRETRVAAGNCSCCWASSCHCH